MKKRINKTGLYLSLDMGLMLLNGKLEDMFKDYPEDPNGVTVEYDDFKDAVDNIVEYGKGVLKEILDNAPVESPVDPIDPLPTELVKFRPLYFGTTNGGRATWYCNRSMNSFPKEFYLTIVNCGKPNHEIHKKLITNNGTRYEDSTVILKESEVGGRGMGIILPANVCHNGGAIIEWEVEVIVEPPEESAKVLTDYLYEASSSKIGQYYVYPPASMLGNIKSVTVGDNVYEYGREWNGSELWYGDPTSGTIKVTLKNGDVYATDVEEKEEPSTGNYETKFHHTNVNGTDGGMAIVLCPGQVMNFDSVSCGGVNIPRHQSDRGRETYWNMHEFKTGDIIAKKGNKIYRYPTKNGGLIFGSCK